MTLHTPVPTRSASQTLVAGLQSLEADTTRAPGHCCKSNVRYAAVISFARIFAMRLSKRVCDTFHCMQLQVPGLS